MFQSIANPRIYEKIDINDIEKNKKQNKTKAYIK